MSDGIARVRTSDGGGRSGSQQPIPDAAQGGYETVTFSAASTNQCQQLHIVVTQKCSNADLLEWAASRPCQIDALARNLVQALQQWPYVLEIITKFCVAKSIRDAFLQQEPTLLFRIVAQAVNGDWQHSTASIAMLSHPLPQHITLPAASQNLFLGIVDHAAQQPSSSSIKPIYSLLKGGLVPLLGLLSHETLNQLERNFVAILRNTIEKQDQCLTLYCLAIMKAMVTASEEDPSFSAAGSYETQELLASTPNSPRWKPKSMQQYFSGSKAQKTLHLIALRVLLSSRETTEDTVDQTVECLRLANEIIMFFPESTRESWCTENPIIVRKLQEKACQSGLNRKVQLSAFAFICSLCRSKNIPEQMVDQVAAMLSHPLNFTADLVTGHEPAMQWFVGVLNGVQLAETLISITSFTMHATPVDIIKCVEVLVATVQCLKRSLKTNESMVGGALTALGSAAVAQELTRLRQMFSVAPTIQPTGHGACDAAVLSSRKTLGNTLCSLFLGAALAADHSQTDVSAELYPLLVETHAASTQNSSSCAHTVTRARIQHTDSTMTTIDSFQPGTNWQHALGELIQEKAKKDHSALSALFFNSCADLERRCVDVEAPLHEEKRQRAELQHQYDNLYTEYTNLEDSKSRVQLRTDALQAEKDEYMHDLEHVREENEDLVSRIEELESKLRQNQDQTQKELEDLKRDFANAEMDHATNLARSEEHLEEVESRLSRLQSERDEEAKAKAQLESELANARFSKVALDADLDHWRTVDEEHKQVIASAERAKDELASRCSGLLADLEVVRQSAAQEKQAHEAHVAGMELELQRHTDELRTHHSNSLKHMEQTHQEALEQATAKLESIRDESRHAQADMEAQIQKSEKRISEYQKKVKKPLLYSVSSPLLTLNSWNSSRKCARRKMTKLLRPTPCARTSWPPWVSGRRTKAANPRDEKAQNPRLVSPRLIQMPQCRSSISSAL